MIDEKDLVNFTLALAPFLGEAHRNKNSMAVIEIDAVTLLKMTGYNKNSGKILVAIAAGPSIPRLKQAIELVKCPH